MVGAEGQEAPAANSYHWESSLLRGHLDQRPDWEVRCGKAD